MYPQSPEAARQFGPAQPQGGNPNFNIHTVLIALRCWWHIALPLGLLLAAGAAAVVYYVSEPTYTASAWLRIRERPIWLVSANAAPEDPQKFVNNQVELFRSPLVLVRVVGDPLVARAPELVDELDPAAYVRTHLEVINKGRSDFFELKFASRSPEHAKIVVNKVADEFLGIQQGHEVRGAQLTIDKLMQQHVAQKNEVNRLFATYEKHSKNYAALAEPESNSKRDDSSRDAAAASLRAQMTAAEVEQVVLQAQIEAERELFEQESFTVDAAQVMAAIETMPVVQQIRERIAANHAKAEEHRQRSTDPSRNFALQQLEKQIQQDEASLEKTLASFQESLKAEMEKAARANREREIAKMEVDLDRLAATTKYLRQRTEQERKEREKVAGDRLQVIQAQNEYERALDILDQLSKRIVEIQMEQQAPERVEILEYASTPTRADEDVPFKKMGMAGAVALLLPFGLAVLIEILYRRVSSRQQLETTGGIAVVAEVTTLPTRARSRRQHDSMPNRERQLFEESIDGLRTYLSLVESMRGRKVLAVTSAISREGKTSLAAQLAVSIAASTNRPTLLIDGDMRSPDIHRIFDIDLRPGLADVLEGTCPVEEAIETGFSEHLHLLTAGELASSPHRILGNGSFAEVLDKVRGMYDYVILDTPPILAASEALLMASAADSAILCVRRDFSRVDQVSDAFARLRTAGVKTAGAVLNGIPPRSYAYRYGSYYYARSRQPAAQAETAEATATETTAG